jgi:hypothetical protein
VHPWLAQTLASEPRLQLRLSERRAIVVMKPPGNRVLHSLAGRRGRAITAQDFFAE